MEERMTEEQMTQEPMTETNSAAEETLDGYFGLCPSCHKTDGFVNVGCSHWFICVAHKTKWLIGENLFSCCMDETAEQQRAEQERLGFGDFQEVEPFCPIPPTSEPQVEEDASWYSRDELDGIKPRLTFDDDELDVLNSRLTFDKRELIVAPAPNVPQAETQAVTKLDNDVQETT